MRMTNLDSLAILEIEKLCLIGKEIRYLKGKNLLPQFSLFFSFMSQLYFFFRS